MAVVNAERNGQVDPGTIDRRFGLTVGAIVGVAFGVRLAYLYQIEAMPFFDHPVGDAASYWDWAGRIAGGDWMGSEPFYQAPAYPYFLAVLRRILGDDLWAVRVVQCALGAVACGLLACAGRRFIAPRAGLCAGGLLACYGPAMFFDGLIQKAALSHFLLALLVYLCACLVSNGRSGRNERSTTPPAAAPNRQRGATANWRHATVALAAGVVLALLALTREQALLLLAAFLAWMTARGITAARSTSADGPGSLAAHAPALALLLGAGAVLGVAGYRNYRVGGELALTTFQAGPNFYIGNHDGATGRYVPLRPGRETPEFEQRDATRLAEAAVGHRLTPRAVSRYWLARAFDDIARDPGTWLRLLAYKWLLVWNAYEIPDTESYTLYRDVSWLLGVCGRVNHFGVLCPLAIVGLLTTLHRWRRLYPLYVGIFILAAGVALFYVFGRYRYPLVALLAILAGAGLGDAWALLRRAGPQGRRPHGERSGKRIGAALLAALLVAGLANVRVNPERRLDGMAYANLGVVLGQQGRYDDAMFFLEQAVAQVPDSVEAYYNLGLAHSLRRDYGPALEHLETARALDPQRAAIISQIAAVYEAMGRPDDAVHHYERALAIDPGDVQARAGLERLRD